MKGLFENSALLAFLQRTAGSSLVVRSIMGAVRKIDRGASVPSSALAIWLRAQEPEEMSRRVSTVLSQSPAVIRIDRWFDRMAHYARDAVLYRRVTDAAARFTSLSPDQVVKLSLRTTAIAAATYIVLNPDTLAFYGFGSLALLLAVVGLSMLPFRSGPSSR